MLLKTDGQLENLERMVHDLEFAEIETRVIDGLKVGNVALKKLHEVLSIDEIEKVMDDTREGIDKQRELDDLLMGTLSEEDETEVEAELEALVARETAETSIEAPEDIILPDVPEDAPRMEKQDEKGDFFILRNSNEFSYPIHFVVSCIIIFFRLVYFPM